MTGCSARERRNEQSDGTVAGTTIKAHCKTLRMRMIASQFGTLAEQAIREKAASKA
ncbi:MAG TPA: hypothetical protein VK335_23375 [Bryobacteraceae bacterium]|nr:hypothetical protein [Bryobacteraceae bacterium]